MSNSTSPSRRGPNQEPLPTDNARGIKRFLGHDDPYQNPSLERYSDLRFEDETPRWRRWRWILLGVAAVIPLIILCFMGAIYAQARNDEARQVDAIVVMGAAQYNGRPSPVLQARLDHALALYNEGLAPLVIVTGGNQPGDAYTEAGTSKEWLIQNGVPEANILIEDTSGNTWDSWEGVSDVAARRHVDSVLIVSDGFHLFRSERMAEAVGFDAYSSAAPDDEIRDWSGEEFSYVVRETAAVIVQMPKWLF